MGGAVVHRAHQRPKTAIVGDALDRRTSVRREPAPQESLARVRLRTGREVAVLNVCDEGLLVEGHVRLLPGTHLDVHIVTATGRVLVRCRVVRSEVGKIAPEGVCYRGAVAFQQPIDTSAPGYGLPSDARGNGAGEGSLYPEGADTALHEGRQRLSA